MKEIKLSKAQKAFIERMRNGETVTFDATGRYVCKFGFDNIETISFNEAFELIMDKIIKASNRGVSLTPIGKKIPID